MALIDFFSFQEPAFQAAKVPALWPVHETLTLYFLYTYRYTNTLSFSLDIDSRPVNRCLSTPIKALSAFAS